MSNLPATLCIGCGKAAFPGKNRCRDCARNHQRLQTKRAAKRRRDALEKIERDACKTLIDKAGTGGANVPHSAELLEQLMVYFGGVNGYAAMFAKQYHEAPPGGSMRTRMLETMTRLVAANTAMGGAQKPVSMMTDDELEAELNGKLQEVASVLARRRSIDGTIEETSGIPVGIGAPAPTDGQAGWAVSAPPADGVAVGGGEPEVRVPEDVPADGPSAEVP
jgi:hypothetical protein